MWIQQVFVTFFLSLLALQEIKGVVNNGIKSEEPSLENNTNNNNNSINEDNTRNTATSAVSDLVAESTEQKNRREAPLGLSDSYGAPIPSNSYGVPLDSYSPSSPGNLALPIPVYGSPDAPSNNIVYPAPPPDIPPVISSPSNAYGPPNIISHDIPPKHFPPMKFNSYFRPQKPFSIPKPIYGTPHFGFPIRSQYGPPTKHSFNFHKLKVPIKIPKLHYGPPSPIYLPYKPTSTYGVPQVYGPPKSIYGPPRNTYGPPPAIKYGHPPEPIPHGPPHPGVPAPPTPPDIKYDGWQPIPGLVSRPPSGSYGSPHVQHVNNQQYNVDLVPPPTELYNHPAGVKDSYNAPLNSVTGSGGIVSTSGNEHGGRGISGSGDKESVSVTKSIGYEIVSSPGVGGVNTYSTAPLTSYTSDQSYNNGLGSSALDGISNSLSSSFETTLSGTSGIGLVPPSGVYGVPPSGSHGTHLFQPNININRPKNPIVFREPVPSGFIESVGISVAQKDAHGVIDNNYDKSVYQPPPVPDQSYPFDVEPNRPSGLYSLPYKNPTSFQNYIQGSSNEGLNVNAFKYNSGNEILTSYTAPLGVVDGSYGLPHVNPHNFGSNNFALTQNYATGGSSPYFGHYQNIPHDCSQKALPLPSLSFGVPAANTYSASLASLNTNIAGAYQGTAPGFNYGVPDLQSAYSHTTTSISNSSGTHVTNDGRIHSDGRAKQLIENIPEGSELIKSQSVDLNNIPLQGALGSYTLQIQSADGGGGNIPHNQVLNDGLLQSILNAIEQPQQNRAAILSEPLMHLQQIPPQMQQQITSGQEYNYLNNMDNQNSITKNIVVTPPPLQRDIVDDNTVDIQHPKNEGVPLVDSNEVALYFNRNHEEEENNIHNAPQYGSYVAFSSANSSYTYGDETSKSGFQHKEVVETELDT